MNKEIERKDFTPLFDYLDNIESAEKSKLCRIRYIKNANMKQRLALAQALQSVGLTDTAFNSSEFTNFLANFIAEYLKNSYIYTNGKPFEEYLNSIYEGGSKSTKTNIELLVEYGNEKFRKEILRYLRVNSSSNNPVHIDMKKLLTDCFYWRKNPSIKYDTNQIQWAKTIAGLNKNTKKKDNEREDIING